MTNEEAVKLHRMARCIAIRKGYGYLADDFAQEAVMHLFRGRKASFLQLLTDYLRKEHGDIRYAWGRAKRFAHDTFIELEDYVPQVHAADHDGPNVRLNKRVAIENAMRITRGEIDRFLNIVK